VLGDPSGVDRVVAVVDNLGNLDAALLPSAVTVVARPDNPGFGAGVNAGVAALDPESRCTLYVALNNDTVLTAGFLDAAASALEVGVGAAGGPIRDPERGSLWYAGGGVSFLTGTVRQEHSERAAASPRDVGFIPATAMAIAPAAWRELGGFDPWYFLYNEDLDLCLRLRRAGWRLRFEPGMACRHRLGTSTGSAERSPLYLENLTRTRLRPFASRPYRAYLAVVHTVYNALRIVALGVRQGTACQPHVAAVVRGHLAALRRLSE
jgi:GT2 family glycosyltransferase